MIPSEQQKARERLVQAAIAYIKAHFQDVGLTMDVIAAGVHYSKYHLSRCFMEVVGETPMRVLARVRCEKAAELLATSTLSVTEITQMVGYQSHGAFSAVFTQRYGMTATQYRRVHTATSDEAATEA